MFDSDTRAKKQSALKTLLEIMGVPEQRQDTTKVSNIHWLAQNLQANYSGHPLFETARALARQLLRDQIKRNGKLVGALARAQASVSGYEHWGAVVQWDPQDDGTVSIVRDDDPNGVLVNETFDPS